MDRWSIDRIRSVPPEAGSDRGAAFAIHFDSGPEPQMTVEYARGAERHASQADARRAVAPYLDDEHPPRRIIVGRDGKPVPLT